MADPNSLKEKGNEAFKVGHYDDAVSYYTQALSEAKLKDLERAVLYKNRAACFFKMEKYQEAVNDATHSLDLAPEYTEALYSRCQAYERLGKLEEAHKDALLLTKVEPLNNDVMIMFNKLDTVVQQRNAQSLTFEEQGIPRQETGANEMQGLEGLFEADLRKHFKNCTKNPDHKLFIPFSTFNMFDLPFGLQDNDIVEVVKSIADLTVRISVQMVSPERPEFVPYPGYGSRGSAKPSVGTGMLYKFSSMNEDCHKVTCTCPTCQTSDTPSKEWFQIRMRTAKHVVFDEIEAKHTSCRLFYDRNDSPLVTLKGWELVKSSIEEDMCELQCGTCDGHLMNKLGEMWMHLHEISKDVYIKYQSSKDKDKLIVIVSHPHGCLKVVSVGQWITQPKKGDWNGYKYTYTACTCQGSSGAYVFSLGRRFTCLHSHAVHSEGVTETINASGVGKDNIKFTVTAGGIEIH